MTSFNKKYSTLIAFLIIAVILIGTGYALGERGMLLRSLISTYLLILSGALLFVLIVYKYFYKYKITILTIILPLFIFLNICEDLLEKQLSVFDNAIYGYVSELISKNMTIFMKAVSFLGSGVVLTAIVLLSLIIFRNSKKYFFYSQMIILNLILSSLLNTTFKMFFHRERPSILRLAEAGGFSFPSGHSMISMCFYGFIIFIIYKNMRNPWRYIAALVLSLLIIMIGISRIYLGVHFASDVIAGFSAGLAWLSVFIALVKKTKAYNSLGLKGL